MNVADWSHSGAGAVDRSASKIEALRRELVVMRQMLSARDDAICDLHERLAAIWDRAMGDREQRDGPTAEQPDELPDIEDKLLIMLPDLYEYILRCDEQIQTAINGFQASLARLEQGIFSNQASISSGRLGYQEYQQLIQRIRLVVGNTVAPGSTVIVVSKGDDELLKLDGRQAWHFPQTVDGTYAGYYPANSAEAISHLEALRAKGGEYLLFPNTSVWWLDYYSEFRQHLEDHYCMVLRQEDACTIFALRDLETTQSQTADDIARLRYYHLTRQIQEIVHSILPSDATVLVVSKGDSGLLSLIGPKAQHFPQTPGGEYAGYYPANSAAAIAHLEAVRLKGADYLLLPATAFWWLEHYRKFTTYLEKHYRIVVHQQYCCLIFSLQKPAPNVLAQEHRSGQAYSVRRYHHSASSRS
jgi:hypothetical protein